VSFGLFEKGDPMGRLCKSKYRSNQAADLKRCEKHDAIISRELEKASEINALF